MAPGRRERLVRRRDNRSLLGKVLAEPCAVAGQTPWPGDRPWRLRMRAGALELLADRSSRPAVLAAGAALLNLRIALAHTGLEPAVSAVPRGEPEVLARVRADEQRLGASGDHHLYAELQRLQAATPRFSAPALPPGLTAELTAAAEAEEARLVPRGDGWPVGTSYAVGLLVTGGDSVVDWLRAGQAAQRLLLTARTAWLAVHCRTGPLETPGARERMRRDHCPDGVPQVILEIGQRTATVA